MLSDVALVERLITSQFPQWKDLLIRPVAHSGWDNRSFHLGTERIIRMLSAAEYEPQVVKEYHWLPKLAPFLPLRIPEPLALGRPDRGYPWKWSIYRWIEGIECSSATIIDVCGFATDLADFLLALQHINSTGGPLSGLHSFYRGGSLAVYDKEVHKSLAILKDSLHVSAVAEVWEAAFSTSWNRPPVWVHRDISLGNLLIKNGALYAVIDFGQIYFGDSVCDLAIAWTFFKDEDREIFRTRLGLDAETWARGRGWTLWKALITAAGLIKPNNCESTQYWRIIDEVLADYLRDDERREKSGATWT
ncbi:MAG: aminoglycoside phosphotransferase family protein [Chlamydia sp.]